MNRPRLVFWLVAALASCKEHEFQPPSRAEQVTEAEAAVSAATFDTVHWDSPEQRIAAGNVVYSERCRRCHGTMGEGGTSYARERGLAVPSLVEPDWRYGAEPLAVRKRIYAGHPAGMPTWGVAGITPREIDAVAEYLLVQLRPEVERSRRR